MSFELETLNQSRLKINEFIVDSLKLYCSSRLPILHRQSQNSREFPSGLRGVEVKRIMISKRDCVAVPHRRRFLLMLLVPLFLPVYDPNDQTADPSGASDRCAYHAAYEQPVRFGGPTGRR